MDRARPRTRCLEHKGLVRLSSAAGYYWMGGYLFVDDQPYYARGDRQGRFRLDKVPPGRYQVVCWLPNWNVVRKEVDPETAVTARLAWAVPKEQTLNVNVPAGRTSEFTYRWSQSIFANHGE